MKVGDKVALKKNLYMGPHFAAGQTGTIVGSYVNGETFYEVVLDDGHCDFDGSPDWPFTRQELEVIYE